MNPQDKSVEKLTDSERLDEMYRLFHKCWGQAHDSPDYRKEDWTRFSNIIDLVRGPQVTKGLTIRQMESSQLQEEWRRAVASFEQRGDHGGSPGEGAWERMGEIETELKRRGERVPPGEG